MSAYAADVAALARKDLLLELRSRDTLPAMLLFVVSALTVFHFALPAGSSARAETGLLWIAILFTALLGLTRAFAAEREQGLLDGLVLAPCDRSAIWLGKTIGVTAFLVLAELVALPAFALFFHPLSWELVAAVALADVGIAAIGTLLAAIAAASPGAGAAPAAPVPAARDPGRHRRCRGERRRKSRLFPRVSRPLRRCFCDSLLGEL